MCVDTASVYPGILEVVTTNKHKQVNTGEKWRDLSNFFILTLEE